MRERLSGLVKVGLMVGGWLEVWVWGDKGLCLLGVVPYACLPGLSCTRVVS